MNAPSTTTDRAPVYCFRFHPWKYAYVRRYLADVSPKVKFCFGPRHARLLGLNANSHMLMWGTADEESLRALASRVGCDLWRMEDGFLRSVGLGSDRTVPASLVLDRQGIYYDPTRPSDLETILETTAFSQEELTRARALRDAVVSMGVSKYNVGDRNIQLPVAPAGKRVLLVPGQVEDDASIRLGCVDVRTNSALLEEARRARPDAFIIYKPHPDVVSGNRLGLVPREVTDRCADAVVMDAPLPACLAIADEVHTMTSLVGYEALLRGREVTAYGLPFYAGWGLCNDRHKHPRRTRRLTLDELVAGVMIRYPLYMHPQTMERATPEQIAQHLKEQIERGGNLPVKMGFFQRKLMKFVNALRGIFG